MSEEESLHDQLVRAYLEYFEVNEWWERKNSVRAYAAVQQKTRKIKQLAKARNDEIREIYHELNPKVKKANRKK